MSVRIESTCVWDWSWPKYVVRIYDGDRLLVEANDPGSVGCKATLECAAEKALDQLEDFVKRSREELEKNHIIKKKKP